MANGKITGQELADGLVIANASLTGISTAPTAAAITNSTQIATTAFVNNAMGNHGHGNITNLGAIGSTANLIVKTNTNGVLTTLAAGTTAQYLRGDGTWSAIDLSPYASIANPTFTGIMGVTAEQNVTGVVSEKVGTGTITGTSVTITDSFITASTFVSVIPIGSKTGIWSVASNAGNFVLSSTASESGIVFKWVAIK